MHVFIIGGTGLISTGITRQLVDAGHEVTVFTRGETDAAIPESVDRVTGDRTDDGALAEATDGLDVDCVVDMVAFDPAEVERAVDAFAGEVDQYVFCSTIDVYHRPVADMPVTESAARAPPVSDYGRKKADCEDVLFEAYRTDGFPVTIIRPWDTYGEGGTLNDTLSTGAAYIDRLRAGDPIVVHGDGSTVWATCHRDDVAGAFVGAVGNQEAVGEAYHATGEHPMTWNQYHRRAADALDAPDPDLVYVPTDTLREALPDRTRGLRDHYRFSAVFDNAKARRDLGFEQTVSWEEGVRRTAAWLDDHGRTGGDADEEHDRVVAAWRDAEAAFVETVRDGA
ncbi:NAD-dependent epimerase/dehydratase family protein [Candidatus Halobonum tyrrellensis]|uniref:NAD-dependent epimerase/dehydratase n=1 Tax=Candidatus Halobonum tyrrellensis G22 TaxID=1324957 RepID=V4GNI7_9EURY|nr:NAD-dependent epimerase/dehydratase family protein [Candidatus Halobonum tyrrellensis]ESP86956.1 NAD-dependent epimerase/dehydratase [Candidatus Halobonum tyrrellensis G22]